MSDGSTIQPVFDGNAMYLLDLIFKLKNSRKTVSGCQIFSNKETRQITSTCRRTLQDLDAHTTHTSGFGDEDESGKGNSRKLSYLCALASQHIRAAFRRPPCSIEKTILGAQFSASAASPQAEAPVPSVLH